MLRIEKLSKSFSRDGAPVTAVQSVSLDIPKGQMVGVIGRSGAGKSTLLRLLNRLVEPSAGRISHDGENVTALSGRALRAWRAQCAMIFQQFNLVGRLDVMTNVMLGGLFRAGTIASLLKRFTEADRIEAIQALMRLDLVEQALQRADTLSGGQQQRVAIARALAQRPSLILADEPIASLDPRNAARVMEALRQINQDDGITVICNLHTLDTARTYCDRIVAMTQGRVVFDGAPAELTTQRLHEIYGVDGIEEQIDEAITSTSVPRRLAVAVNA